MCYVNYGGIGFTLDVAGDIPLVAEHCKEPLRLVDLPGQEFLLIPAPETGWNQALLIDALQSNQAKILEEGAADAFLGSRWIGSTEV